MAPPVGIVRPSRQRVTIAPDCMDLSESESMDSSLNSTMTAGSIFEDLTGFL